MNEQDQGIRISKDGGKGVRNTAKIIEFYFFPQEHFAIILIFPV